jgi:hypothetical protein
LGIGNEKSRSHSQIFSGSRPNLALCLHRHNKNLCVFLVGDGNERFSFPPSHTAPRLRHTECSLTMRSFSPHPGSDLTLSNIPCGNRLMIHRPLACLHFLLRRRRTLVRLKKSFTNKLVFTAVRKSFNTSLTGSNAKLPSCQSLAKIYILVRAARIRRYSSFRLSASHRFLSHDRNRNDP